MPSGEGGDRLFGGVRRAVIPNWVHGTGFVPLETRPGGRAIRRSAPENGRGAMMRSWRGQRCGRAAARKVLPVAARDPDRRTSAPVETDGKTKVRTRITQEKKSSTSAMRCARNQGKPGGQARRGICRSAKNRLRAPSSLSKGRVAPRLVARGGPTAFSTTSPIAYRQERTSPPPPSYGCSQGKPMALASLAGTPPAWETAQTSTRPALPVHPL